MAHSHHDLKGIDGEKEKVLKEEQFIQTQGPIWHEMQVNMCML